MEKYKGFYKRQDAINAIVSKLSQEITKTVLEPNITEFQGLDKMRGI